MKPDKIYEGPSTIRMYNCDCMELMEGRPKDHWGLAIVDPPYGIGVNNMTMFDGAKKQKRHKEYNDQKPDKRYFNKLFSKSINQVIWGGNYFNLPSFRCYLIWDKIQKFSGSDSELAWTSFDKVSKTFRMCRAQAYGNGTIHPTQKPIKLYRWILQNYAKEGDTILDTHGGSMSLAIACWEEGFDLDICELDKDYFNAAAKRFEDHIAQQKLF